MCGNVGCCNEIHTCLHTLLTTAIPTIFQISIYEILFFKLLILNLITVGACCNFLNPSGFMQLPLMEENSTLVS